MADPILILVSAVVTLAGVPGMLLYAGVSWRKLGSDIGVLAALWILAGLVCGVTGLLPGGFAILVAAMGILMGAAVSAALAETISSSIHRMLVVAGFTLLIFLPLSLVVFGGGGTWLYRDAGALDFAGALPLAVGTGTFLTVFAMGSSTRTYGDGALALRGAMLVAIAALGCAVGLELRIDELTPAIALNMVMTPAVAILAAAGIERVKRGRNTREGLAAGTLAGTAAAIAACAYLETVSALLLGLVVGAVAEAAFRGSSTAWRMATPLLIGGVTGLLFLGIFALDVGFVYSGQPILLGQQALISVASFVGSLLVSVALLYPLRKYSIRPRSKARL
ncbi:MAG: hypothetical protein ABI238_02910 [Terrimesophilobacter sp.]